MVRLNISQNCRIPKCIFSFKFDAVDNSILNQSYFVLIQMKKQQLTVPFKV